MKTLTKPECLKFLRKNYIGRLGYFYRGRMEIVPITYHLEPGNDMLISYSGEGDKIKAMRKNSQVAFLVDEINGLHDWKSVLVYGVFEELDGIDAKKTLHTFSEGVKEVILEKEHKAMHYISEFSNKVGSNSYPVIYRIKILDCSGRQEMPEMMANSVQS